MTARRPASRRIVPLLDLTNLDESCATEAVIALCDRARQAGVAAVCVWPRFVAQARKELRGSSVRVATVLNFPAGEVTTAWEIPADADEVDVVFPWQAFLAGDAEGARTTIESVRAACGDRLLKVILESGAFPAPESLRAACDLCLDAGADFLKTSTGKRLPGATPEAVRVLCAASRAVGKQVGVKISGGVRTLAQAQEYLEIVADLMGLNWIEAAHVRFGASALLDALEAA